MPNDLAHYLREGAEKLKDIGLQFASSSRGDKFDTDLWKALGRSRWGGKILVPKNAANAAKAVAEIFNQPGKWQFDCSQFVQVVNYYAWLKVLGDGDFNANVIASGGIKIQPFIGSIVTTRKHYYRRESRKEWMRYRPDGDKSREQQTCMTAWDIVDAAPIGSRVNFTNDKAQHPSWRYENTIKVSGNEFIAHHGRGGKNVFKVNELITFICRLGAGRPSADFDEANKHIWIKEVEYHVDVPTPVTCLSR